MDTAKEKPSRKTGQLWCWHKSTLIVTLSECNAIWWTILGTSFILNSNRMRIGGFIQAKMDLSRSWASNIHSFRSIHKYSNRMFCKRCYASYLMINPFDLQYQECCVSHVYFSWIFIYSQCNRFLCFYKNRFPSP